MTHTALPDLLSVSVPALALACCVAGAAGQIAAPGTGVGASTRSATLADEDAPHDAWRATAIAYLLAHDEDGAWPYEGVYRVGGRIPVGYVVGGTALVAQSLLEAPGYADDAARQAAVARACELVCESIGDPAMGHAIEGGYDVRGWGYATGAAFLARLRRDDAVPDGQDEALLRALVFFVAGLEATVIPDAGGWNYARRRGFDAPGDSSPFMTSTTLQALFDAAAVGVPVDADMVAVGLDALEAARTDLGSYVYAGRAGPRTPDGLPGATGRMLASEVTLRLAGRGSLERVRAALDAFLVHWDALEVRRAQSGTHKAPWGVAPYYFHFAHRYAGQAAELLPDPERGVYRARVRERLGATRADDGSWNDRVFERSASYGTAMALMVLCADSAPQPSRWESADAPAAR